MSHELPVMVLDAQLEQMIGQSLQQNRGIVEPNLLDNLVRSIGDSAARMESEGAGPVLLVSGVIRTFLSRLLRGRMSNFYILAYEEVPADKSIRVVTTVGNAT
jgi:flagellar biosynthesis protein FlhA